MVIKCPFCSNEYNFGITGQVNCPACNGQYQPTKSELSELNFMVIYTGIFKDIFKDHDITIKRFFYENTLIGERK